MAKRQKIDYSVISSKYDVKNPYKIPSPAIVNFSGGRTSGYLLRQLQLAGNDFVSIFCNTGREDPRTLDFVNEFDQRFGTKTVWLEYRCLDGKHSFVVVDYKSASRGASRLGN